MIEIHWNNNISIDGVPSVFDVRPVEGVVLGNSMPQDDNTDRGSLPRPRMER